MLKNLIGAVMISALSLLTATAHAVEVKPLKGQTALKVCADPNNMPYSNDKLEGFDNKIAALLGEKLGIPVEYTWFPQRIGFSRNTIKKVDEKTGHYLCDLAMSVPSKSDFLATTKPYFSSIQTMVYRKGEGYELKTLEDIAKVSKSKKLKIGIFDRGVTTAFFMKNGLADQLKYYQMMPGDTKVNAGRIITEALASGEIDVAMVWGPVGGYYATQTKVPMVVQPLNELTSRFVFSFGMGVRYPDKKWKQVLNTFLDENKDQIAQIMSEYNLPSLENVVPDPHPRKAKKDDDD